MPGNALDEATHAQHETNFKADQELPSRGSRAIAARAVRMTETEAFVLQHSDLNPFLFAEIRIETNGMPLSVLSALARLDMDPWKEARRLASLPADAAIRELARIIVVLSMTDSVEDATATARRVAACLPERGAEQPATHPTRSPKGGRLVLRGAAIAFVMLVLAGLVSMEGERQDVSMGRIPASPSTITASSKASAPLQFPTYK